MSKLLETFQELNLSNYGPDDVDQLNAWAIDAYAELSAIKAQGVVIELPHPVPSICKAGKGRGDEVTFHLLNKEGDPIGGDPAGGYANDNARLRAELSALKAQGVVMPERWNVPRPMWKDARQPYGNPLNHADIEAAEKFNLALDEVARLNAAPAQQVSVPAWMASSRAFADRLYMAGWRDHADAQHSGVAGMYDELLAAAPAALSHGEQVRDALADLLECPASVVQATVPRAGIEAAPPYQVVLDVSVSLTRWKKARAALEAAAPAAPAADAWIQVSERLPAVESRLDQECRVGTLSIAPLNISAAVLVFDGEKVKSTRLEWFDGCLPLPYCITHWMPLPAAPAANSAKGVV